MGGYLSFFSKITMKSKGLSNNLNVCHVYITGSPGRQSLPRYLSLRQGRENKL